MNTFQTGWVMCLASLIQQDPIIGLTFCLIEFSLQCSTPLVKRELFKLRRYVLKDNG